ncbi:MAG: DNA primase [Candidatus Nealsonbacteria bacterium RIFCSPLOWO2_01_FULL_43_32]|uniref:DNA primase n=1 Tax=Candidatus Nealsonbacteria bacterium RIFCSPLOWO2_01_FULL_43_32 TaxID=1801672 RepID=A0A1G2EEA6_9BACT|nr:MAG: DNA primase [Candidatus Nealsonbacteria bacterium RIFCSPLOWO2_01_FULL_43_32]
MLSSPIEEIKNRLDIVEVIGNYIRLQKAGANFRAVCPFHSEKKPSLFVSPARQIWHCFGCSVGGDIFKFVMQIEGVEFGDALRILAQKAGVELKKQSPESVVWRTERNRLYEICELTARFFEKQLEASSVGQEARKYLLGRGITEASLKKWRVGYAPDVWQGLSDFLADRGYQKSDIEKAGLALTSEKGSFYDRFRGRIIFPIFDLNSQVVGFGGRVFKEKDKKEIAKYVNTPQTMLYDKGRILYGLDKAKVAIRKQDVCILVEGYVDAMMSAQAGAENVVATSGTALTAFQLKILKRYSNNLLLAFDMDVAGDSATKRGITLAQTQGFNIKIVTMTEGMDPADIVSKNPENWLEMINGAKSILQFYFETTFARFDPQNPEGKREISKILLPIIKRIPNKIEGAHWVQELAKRLNVKEEIVEEELKNVKLDNQDYYLPEFLDPPSPPQLKTRKDILEERVISLVLKEPQHLLLVKEDCLPCFSSRMQTILTDLKQEKLTEGDDFINYLFLKAEVEEAEFDAVAEIQICLKEIEHLETKTKLDEISQEIKRAETEKELERVNNLTREFNKLANKLLD